MIVHSLFFYCSSIKLFAHIFSTLTLNFFNRQVTLSTTHNLCSIPYHTYIISIIIHAHSFIKFPTPLFNQLTPSFGLFGMPGCPNGQRYHQCTRCQERHVDLCGTCLFDFVIRSYSSGVRMPCRLVGLADLA